MTLILELPDNKEAALKARALSEGVSVEQLVQRIVDHILEQPETVAAPRPSGGFLSALPRLWRMYHRKNLRSFPGMARARLTITFTACPREISAAGFRRYLLLDCSSQS